MKGKKHSLEPIVKKLREANAMLSGGTTIDQVPSEPGGYLPEGQTSPLPQRLGNRRAVLLNMRRPELYKLVADPSQADDRP